MRRNYDAEGTVETIVRNGLCTQCGFCEPVCPTKAITLAVEPASGEILPLVEPAACIMCPLCLAVCPGEHVDFLGLQKSHLGIDGGAKYFGHIESAYLAWSTDSTHRLRSASGGVATSLAAFALRSGTLDYIVFARPRQDAPFRTETILTSDPADLERSHGSIYYPVPLGESMNLLFERKVPTDSRLGVIGLPCHVHGALKMMNTGRYKRYRWHIIFGIFCGGTWTYKALDTYLATKGFRRDDVTRFTFRTGGWPGNIEFETTDGQIFSEARHNPALVERVNRASIFSANSFFTPHRCLTCSDGLADLADISFGDPWLKSEREDRVGKTLVITRSSKGLALLKDALSAGLVECTPLEPDLAVVSQKGMLTFKQNYLAFNRVIGLLRGRRTPKYRYSWSDRASVPWSLHVYTLTAYLNYLVGRHINVRWLRIPLSILQGLTARIIKQYFVRLTTRDGENYFS